MTDAHQDFGTRWFEEIWNQKRREAIDEMMAPEAVIHEGGQTVRGANEFYQFFDRMQAAFSDVHVTVHDTVVHNDKIWVRWSCRMTHTGAGLGMPASGKALDTTGMTIFRVASGKTVEAWQNWDMLGLMQQIQGTGRATTYVSSGVTT